MINTILFDLDGTLLKISQDVFVDTYFAKLRKVFEKLGIDPDMAIKGVWIGTKAMTANDGGVLNIKRFWDAFTDFLHLDPDKVKTVEENCDSFYTNEFDSVKEIMEPTEIPKRLITALKEKGFTVVLATNPLFPACAVTTRLRWIGLAPDDFVHITHYANSRYCKPNPGYFHEILDTVKKNPKECIMVGNNVFDDMGAKALGIDTFLVTDYLENETDADIDGYRNGTLSEAEEYLLSLKSPI